MIEPERKGYEVRYRKYKTKGNLKSKDGEPRRKRKYVTKKSRAE